MRKWFSEPANLSHDKNRKTVDKITSLSIANSYRYHCARWKQLSVSCKFNIVARKNAVVVVVVECIGKPVEPKATTM